MSSSERAPGALALRALNFVRWLKEYAVSWGLLSIIYSFTVTLLLQPILEKALKVKLEIAPLWIATAALLLVPGILEALPLPPLSLDRGGLARFMSPGIFGERFWRKLGGDLAPLYLRHELRRGSTWFTLLLTCLSALFLPPGKTALWVLFVQLPAQRALYSIHSWRGLALVRDPKNGGPQLLQSIWISQTIQVAFCWLCVGLSGLIEPPIWIALGPAALGAAISASTVALEGDAGRPWIVNFLSLAAGTLGGYLCLLSPGFLLLVAYMARATRASLGQRLISVEHLDEDRIVP